MAKQQHPVQINPCTLNKICYTVTHILAQHLLNIKGIEGDDLWCGLRMGRPLLVHYNNDTQIIEIQPPPNITAFRTGKKTALLRKRRWWESHIIT